MTTSTKQLVIGYCVLRGVYAIGLLAAPARVAAPWLGDVRPASAAIPTRGVGARELALSAGAIGAVASGSPAHPWLAACALADGADIAATLGANGSELPSRSKVGTVLAAGAFGSAALALAARARDGAA
jgi:hypothetical protein